MPLIVVYIDKKYTSRHERKNDEDKRKRYRIIVLNWIKNIQPIEQDFSQSVHELAKAISESDDKQPQAYALPLTLHEKLNEMTVEQVTDAFLSDFENDKEKRYAHMYNILTNFEYLSKITESVKLPCDTYNKQAFALCQEWNKQYDDLMVHFNGMPNVNPYSTIVTGWMMELFQKPNSVAVHEKELNMLNLVAVKEKDVDTFVKTNKMHHIAVQVQVLNTGYAKNFSDMAQNIDKTLKSLVEAESYFRENEKK